MDLKSELESADEFFELAPDVRQVITTEQAFYYKVVPKGLSNGNWEFYSGKENGHNNLEDELEFLIGHPVKILTADETKIDKTLSKYYRKSENDSVSSLKYNGNSSDSDALLKLINEAYRLESSDLHLEPYEDVCRVRFRVDGKLMERFRIELSDYAAIVNMVKIKSHLDIAEKRLPQDGRIEYDNSGNKFDIRVSVLPTLYGEKVVLRLLNRDGIKIELSNIGLDKNDLDVYYDAIKKPNGIILISGPTGSGKSTTLYATLKFLNDSTRNIVTIEDPVEYTLEGINQVQLKESIGLDFATAMRTFLRQDPDIIMLGEIRDKATAQIAIRASLTGHLVLSTVHTNSAIGTISRLEDMGIPSFFIANTLKLSVAQRLVRKLCSHCKVKIALNKEDLPYGFTASRELEEVYSAVGCHHCFFTGYRGRMAIYELVRIDRELAEDIKQGKITESMQNGRKQMLSLSDKAFEILEKGITSLDEVYALLV